METNGIIEGGRENTSLPHQVISGVNAHITQSRRFLQLITKENDTLVPYFSRCHRGDDDSSQSKSRLLMSCSRSSTSTSTVLVDFLLTLERFSI